MVEDVSEAETALEQPKPAPADGVAQLPAGSLARDHRRLQTKNCSSGIQSRILLPSSAYAGSWRPVVCMHWDTSQRRWCQGEAAPCKMVAEVPEPKLEKVAFQQFSRTVIHRALLLLSCRRDGAGCVGSMRETRGGCANSARVVCSSG